MDRTEGVRVTPLESLFQYVDATELGDPLVVHRNEDGGLVCENDPHRFAATPEVLVSAPGVRVEVTIADRVYVVDGVTRNGDLVLRKLSE